jgi:hypothetical protein
MHSTLEIRLDAQGAADMTMRQETFNQQYEDYIPLLKMDEKDRQRIFQRMVHVPQADISRLLVSASDTEAKMVLDAEVRSNRYATQTGQRLFVPVCPLHGGYTVPNTSAERQENLWMENGYLDEDDITLTIPEGYVVEARPKDVHIEYPFATFTFSLKVEGNTIRVHNRLLRRSGSYDKALSTLLATFYRTISNTYQQKIVLKKASS